MPSLATLSIVGIIALVVLIALYLKMRRRDQIDAMLQKRVATSQIVSRADYMEASEAIPVAISLAGDIFYYENPDLQASFELSRIDEVEYDDELMTGKSVSTGCRVLRLRSHGATFEFVLQPPDCAKWMSVLKPRRLGDGPAAQAV